MITRAVEDLSSETLETVPVDRDWSEGYGDGWDFIEAPTCHACGDYARWVEADRLAELSGIDVDDARMPDVGIWESWRCVDPDCEHFAEEIEDDREGPMMSYAYPLPSLGDADDEYDAADRLRDLPLCIVRRDPGGYPGEASDFELVLTGGGMDLSWEICEAFTRLGFLPPAHFAELPAMCGRGNLSNGGTYDAPVSERDAYLIAACRRTAQEYAARSQRTAASIMRTLDHVEGKDGQTAETVQVRPDLLRHLALRIEDGTLDVLARRKIVAELRAAADGERVNA